jgi:hypothetical protein
LAAARDFFKGDEGGAAGANLSLMIIGIGGVLGLLIGGANGYIQRGWLRHCQPTPFLL